MNKETIEQIKENFEERITCLLLSDIIIELLILVIMIVFDYNKLDAIDFFYLFSVIYLMLGTIYFAWASIVKENSLELISFILSSTLLNAHAVLEVFDDNDFTFFHWLALLVFSGSQIFYFISFYFAYGRYEWRMMSEIEESSPKVLTGYKVFKHYISMNKCDVYLSSGVVFIYFFAVLMDRNYFFSAGIGIGVICLVGLLVSLLAGMQMAKKEKKGWFLASVAARFVVEVLIGFMIFQVVYGLEPIYQKLVYYELIVMSVISVIVWGYFLAVCVWVMSYFGIGLKIIHYHRRENIHKPIL